MGNVNPSQIAAVAADVEARLDRAIASGRLEGLHGMVLTQHGRTIAECYRRGRDNTWGADLGVVDHGADTLHDLRSVTKSVVGLLYGIALDRGLVPPPETAILDALPGYADLADEARRRISIAHVLTMSMGTLWDETVPYTSEANSEIAMERAPDRLRYALDRPIVEPPGRTWTYNGGATALIGAIIAAGAGRPIEDFAREALFEPLGIGRFEWVRSWDGVAVSASGLRLTARDLARIGNLLLAEGVWNGQRIVSAEWIAAATMTRFSATPDNGYGYFWWTGRSTLPATGEPLSWYAGFGNGGQRLFVLPAAGIVLAVFFGNYDQPDFWLPPAHLWNHVVLPALARQ